MTAERDDVEERITAGRALVEEGLGRDGVYRRRILLVAPDERTVVADLEDDFHRFRVTLVHDGSRIVEARGEALRYPWSACPGAVEPLHALEGAPLPERCTELARHADPHLNCTHLFDLAGLAAVHARVGRERRRYDVTVPDRDDEWRTSPSVERDGEIVLAWETEAGTISAPDEHAGVSLRGGFRSWVESLPPDEGEAAWILRRATEIAMGRVTPWDRFEHAIDVGEFMLGTCHAFQPGTAETATRIRGTIRDFTDDADGLLS